MGGAMRKQYIPRGQKPTPGMFAQIGPDIVGIVDAVTGDCVRIYTAYHPAKVSGVPLKIVYADVDMADAAACGMAFYSRIEE